MIKKFHQDEKKSLRITLYILMIPLTIVWLFLILFTVSGAFKTDPSQNSKPETSEVSAVKESSSEETSEEAEKANLLFGVELWDSIKWLDMSLEELQNFYDDVEEMMYSDYPNDGTNEEMEAYENNVIKTVGEKYNLSFKQANDLYSFLGLEYPLMTNNGEEYNAENLDLLFGEFREFGATGTSAALSIKLKPNLTNKMTINSCWSSVYDLILTKDLTNFPK